MKWQQQMNSHEQSNPEALSTASGRFLKRAWQVFQLQAVHLAPLLAGPVRLVSLLILLILFFLERFLRPTGR